MSGCQRHRSYSRAFSYQPLASEIGMRILKAGGNAADAAVAVAAALNGQLLHFLFSCFARGPPLSSPLPSPPLAVCT